MLSDTSGLHLRVNALERCSLYSEGSIFICRSWTLNVNAGGPHRRLSPRLLLRLHVDVRPPVNAFPMIQTLTSEHSRTVEAVVSETFHVLVALVTARDLELIMGDSQKSHLRNRFTSSVAPRGSESSVSMSVIPPLERHDYFLNSRCSIFQ